MHIIQSIIILISNQQLSPHALSRAGAHVCAYTRSRSGYCGTMLLF